MMHLLVTGIKGEYLRKGLAWVCFSFIQIGVMPKAILMGLD